ncbi:MAG: FHA domain-containing protein [Spirochaetales bacterium]|nr:FHA domain-containing protein [Spirochaetales bacterium]
MLLNNKKTDNAEWYLEAQHSGGEVYSIPIDKDPFIIGRKNDCHLILPARDISRNHAKIFKKGTALLIKDLQSTNGTFINQKRIKEEESLNNGDLVQFGSMKFRICKKDEEELEHTATFFSDSPQDEEDFFSYFNFTSREKEIFFLLIDGKATKEIATTLFISPGTAKNHVLNIFKKTNVHSRMMLMTKYLNFKQHVNE